MLTHANFISNVQACKSLIDVSETDVLLSFLPLSHVFERLGGHYVPLFSGAKVAYAESTSKVRQNMKEVAPTVMLSVPRLYETMHERNSACRRKKVRHRSNRKFSTGVFPSVQPSVPRFNREKSRLQFCNYSKTSRTNWSSRKLKAATGGRLRFFVSGGAALPQSIAEFFHAAGILILEGYGLTETSPVISINHPEKVEVRNRRCHLFLV